MAKVSVIIPSRNEQFLAPTIHDLFEKAEGDIEVIAILDGYWPIPWLDDYPNLEIIHRGTSYGMRAAINKGVNISTGTHIFKLDAHCAVDQGFDVKLVADCEEDWVVVPRRYSLDAEEWKRREKAPYDHMLLSYPDQPLDYGGAGYHGKAWRQKDRIFDSEKEPIFDLMSFQGSGWFMRKEYFRFLELMDEENYGTFWQEAQEIGIKCFWSGGMVKRNTLTWYAHLHKGRKYGRGYFLDKRQLKKPVRYTNEFISGHDHKWHKQIPGRDLRWLVQHFWPVPGWPQKWAPENG